MSNSEYREGLEAARQAGLQERHEQRLARATYTAAEVKVLTETASKVAYALGRKDAGKEIVTAIAAQYVPVHNVGGAESIPSDPTVPSGVPRRSDLPQDSQAVREPPSDPPGPGVGHRRCDCERGHPIDVCAECGEDWPCGEAP